MDAPVIIWDWNGTLLDDTRASLNALNTLLAARHLKPITMRFYRDHFAFPVRPFYETCGIDLANEDWDALARDYHRLYAQEGKRLNSEALAALDAVRSHGIEQCVLSILRQDLLDEALTSFGIRDFFTRVCGTQSLDGASKLDQAKKLKSLLGETRRVVMIGDALHDAEVARALHVPCVLCAQGGHSAARLRAVAPCGETLLEAVSLALKVLE